MAKFCTECGHQNVDAAVFCGGCGEKMDGVVSPEITLKQRGKVLRDATSGAGLISSGGRQFEFTLEKNWRSDVAPKVNMVVEFDMGEDGELRSVSAINENQLAKEQADIAMKAAKEKGQALLKDASARLGMPVLVAWAAVAVSWFFLNTLSITITSDSSIGLTFWKMLGIVNNSTNMANLGGGGTGDTGIYGLLVFLALAGPVISQFWKHPVAHLGNCLPFTLMLFVAIMIYMNLHHSASQAQEMAGSFGGRMASDMVNQMMSAIMKAIHVGAGAPIAIIASVYLAFVGTKQFFVAKAQS